MCAGTFEDHAHLECSCGSWCPGRLPGASHYCDGGGEAVEGAMSAAVAATAVVVMEKPGKVEKVPTRWQWWSDGPSPHSAAGRPP